ncbi:growth arrest-specific protein 7-like [Xenia sp. Carnegie-2017]|uniref:growth arrest-specific protein 7-like n=1 Tax=Xenia sp. Carnegie-2017 TaxID=2897299 RepID=UPI001F04746B|nr:growth arrest-specific protein 7-like [Xenia sp. Carnegie-2017]
MAAQQSSKALDKYEKAVKKTVQAGQDHRKAVELYNANQKKWVDDMVSSCSVLENQEVDRVEFIKQQIMLYVFLRKEVNETCEKAMGGIIQEAQQINALKDRKLFVEKHGTGSIRPVDMP